MLYVSLDDYYRIFWYKLHTILFSYRLAYRLEKGTFGNMHCHLRKIARQHRYPDIRVYFTLENTVLFIFTTGIID